MNSPSSDSPKLVSVIVPTYNRAAMAREAVESVRRQTYPNVQIIVVDDGSTDETPVQMQALPDILFIRQENQGQAAARNAGLARAEGAYICTLDSDDIWQPDFLEKCIAALEALDADFVFANWIGEDAQHNRYHSYWEKFYHWWDFPRTAHPGWRMMEAQPARDMYLDSCLSPSSALVFRRELVEGGWSRRLNIGDDWCMILDAVLNRPCKVAFTMQRLWLKRVSGDNIYDQRDHYEVKVALHLNDSHCLLQRFKGVLTRKERARFYGHLAFHRYGMAKHEILRGKLHTTLLHTAYCLLNIGRGIQTSPADAWAKARTSRWKLRPAVTAPNDELQFENLPPLDSNYSVSAEREMNEEGELTGSVA